jgi:hypothetical protein
MRLNILIVVITTIAIVTLRYIYRRPDALLR